MKISFLDKVTTLLQVFGTFSMLPTREKLKLFLKPLESTRYTEFTYLLKFLKENNISIKGKVLDVSSPFLLAYILSKNAFVVKTDIFEAERKSIQQSNSLIFENEDGTCLSYPANSFDFVYSISVIEHIYQKYETALKEMVRVCKPDGLIYISTPVSNVFIEEWIDKNIYSNQHKEKNKVFFQYVFSKDKIDSLLKSVDNDTQLLCSDIYWESEDKLMDKYIGKLILKHSFLSFIWNSLIHYWYGFTLLENKPKDFGEPKSFGNISFILKKNS